MHHRPTSLQSLLLLASLVTLGAGPALAQDPLEDGITIEPGVLAFELDPDLPSTLRFDLEELETHLCGGTAVTTATKAQDPGMPDPPSPSIELKLGPLLLCTEIKEPDAPAPGFDDGQGVLIGIDDPTTLAENGTGTIGLRPDILHFAAVTPFDLSCGEWGLEVDLFGAQDPSPAEILSQGDGLGGLMTTHLHVELELLFTEVQTGQTVSLLRDQTFSGAADWSAKAIDLGLADAAYTVRRGGDTPDEPCVSVVEIAAKPFSVGWSAKKNPAPSSFCLTDWNGQGQLCLRPWSTNELVNK